MHTSWRNVLNPHLSPNRVLAYDDIVRKDVNTLIDRFIANGKCEFISELGSILPGWAFFKNVLGVPVDDLNKLVASVENGTFAPVAERGKHFAYIFEYLDSYLRERQELPPRGDLVDTILEGVCYEDGSQAPWEHKVSILVDITFGGIATTTYVMASGIHFLATHQEDREALLADPSLMDSAIEEFVRVFPPVVSLGRTCTEDVEVNGVKMKSGDFVMINYAASSRDPRVVDHADTIDIRRKSVLHTAFGAGPHRCIGSHLARVELRATFEEWLKRIPEFKLAEGTEPVFQTGFLRSMRELHLEF
jgi:cytochrome P450